MGMDSWEYQQEEAESAYQEELYENVLKERAIEEFTEERLTSYYFENPSILLSSFEILNESKSVLNHSPSASLLLSCTAIEVAVNLVEILEIADFIIHSAGTTCRDVISGKLNKGTERKDFACIFSGVDERMCSFMLINRIGKV